jgi:kynureninase
VSTPDRLRLGPAPLYTRYVDVWDTMDRLRTVLDQGAHAGYPVERTRVP